MIKLADRHPAPPANDCQDPSSSVASEQGQVSDG
jgi:hypothetical protein